jgi:hypothetical protein
VELPRPHRLAARRTRERLRARVLDELHLRTIRMRHRQRHLSSTWQRGQRSYSPRYMAEATSGGADRAADPATHHLARDGAPGAALGREQASDPCSHTAVQVAADGAPRARRSAAPSVAAALSRLSEALTMDDAGAAPETERAADQRAPGRAAWYRRWSWFSWARDRAIARCESMPRGAVPAPRGEGAGTRSRISEDV